MSAPTTADSASGEVRGLEMDLLLEGIWRRYGYDFRTYDRGFMEDRVRKFVARQRLSSVTRLLERILREPEAIERFMAGLSSPSGSLFRPAPFWKALRRKAISFLRTYPAVRVWCAGCASPEVLYSLAILCHEGLKRKFSVYATDTHEGNLSRARLGLLRGNPANGLARSYQDSGGQGSLTDFVESEGRRVTLARPILEKFVFAGHNLATDSSFNTFHLILAWNPMEGFGPDLRSRTYSLLHHSLVRLGFLALGPEEEIERSPHARCYRTVDRKARIYQKVRE
jgi:chemotaxis protein methyltransferase CheR